jgi:hypothetical protein
MIDITPYMKKDGEQFMSSYSTKVVNTYSGMFFDNFTPMFAAKLFFQAFVFMFCAWLVIYFIS